MIGTRLKDIRKADKITQTELASYMGVTQTTITSWENNRTEPNGTQLIKLANRFNVTIDYLLGKTSTPFPEKSNDLDILLNYPLYFKGHLLDDRQKRYLRALANEMTK